jgi:hypothetical protein
MAEEAVNLAYASLDRQTNKETVDEASGGMLHLQPKTLHPGYRIFRFAATTRPEDWLTKGWWIGFSPFATIEGLAGRSPDRIGRVAREALAVWIDPSTPYFNAMDMLLVARVRRTLAAWTGTPRTISTKRGGRYAERWQPDRNVTQLYIPGLGKIPPGALALEEHRAIPANRWMPAR